MAHEDDGPVWDVPVRIGVEVGWSPTRRAFVVRSSFSHVDAAGDWQPVWSGPIVCETLEKALAEVEFERTMMEAFWRTPSAGQIAATLAVVREGLAHVPSEDR